MFRPHLFLMLVLATAVSACGTTDHREFTEDEALQQSVLPKHADFDNPGLLQSLLTGNKKENEKKAAESEARIARLEKALQQEQLARETQQPQTVAAPIQPQPGQLFEKMGLILPGSLTSDLQEKLAQALQASSHDYPVAVVSTQELGRQLQEYGCTTSQVDRCSEQLVIYPGVHYLAQISRLQVSEDQAVAELRLHDLQLGTTRAAVIVELPAADGEVTVRALRGLTDKIMTDVLTAARATPWSTRAFDQEQDEIFLAAGQRSGLEPGMVLAVHEQGRLVRSPTGSIAGWIPGAKKGELQVTQLFGDDYAIAELLDGQPPTPNDPVLKAQK